MAAQSYKGAWKARTILIMIVALAAFLRLYHIDYGIEKTYPVPVYDLDELGVIDPIYYMLQTESIDPGIYVHSNLTHYLIILAALPCRTFILQQNIWFLVIIARCLVAAMGITTIPLTYLLSKRTYGDRNAALLASLFLCISVFHIRESRFVMMDSIQTFFLVIAALAILTILKHATTANYLKAGAAIGLATGAKQSGLMALIILLACHFFMIRGRTFKQKCSDGKLYAAIFLALGVFAVVSPFSLIRYRAFLKEFFLTSFVAQKAIVMEWHADFLGSRLLTDDIVNLLWGMGPVFILALIGVAYALIRHRQCDVFTLLWVALFGGPVVLTYSKYSRYYVSLLPFLSMLASVATVDIYRQLRNRACKYSWAFLVTLLASAGTIWAIAFVNMYPGEDYRTKARDWLLRNMTEHRVVYVDAKTHYMPQQFDPGKLHDIREIDLGPLVDRNIRYRDLHRDNWLFLWLKNHEAFTRWARFDQDVDEEAYFAGILQSADVIVESDFNLKKYERVAATFPTIYDFYRDLFAEKLGFTVAKKFSTLPSICGHSIEMGTSDVCCRYFDQGSVYIFTKSPKDCPRQGSGAAAGPPPPLCRESSQ